MNTPCLVCIGFLAETKINSTYYELRVLILAIMTLIAKIAKFSTLN